MDEVKAFCIRYHRFFIRITSLRYNWNFEQLERYENVLSWDLISENENIVWSDDIIFRFWFKCNWDKLSANKAIPFTEKFIEDYRTEINWQKLSENPSLPWSLKLIEKYKYKWDWYNLTINENIPWDTILNDLSVISLFELLEPFWGRLSYHPRINFNSELLTKYFSRWDWYPRTILGTKQNQIRSKTSSSTL